MSNPIFKKTLLLGSLLALAAISIPVINLMSHQQNQETEKLVARIQDPTFKKAAPIFQNKCMDCHSAQAQLPFYADFPVARDIIREDMEHGKSDFDLTGKFADNGQGFTELDFARLEKVLTKHSMPPLPYVAMHWNARLSGQDEKDLLDWVRHTRTERRLALGVHADFAGEPIPPLPLTVKADPAKVLLGRSLFHDTRLSGDNTISCASCHALNRGGTDRAAVATGIRAQLGPINTPTVFNATYNVRQFWDGRAADLKEQAGGPVTNPKEMGGNWPEVLGRLQRDSKLVAAFKRLYPDGLTSGNIQDAIATFETTLVTPNSRFDQYLRGNKTILSQQEIKGYELFKANCASCHAGANMGSLSFAKMGRRADYFGERGTPLADSDYGRFNFTHKERDKFRFKVPTLRNVAQTAPYFHDASAKTLEDAVRKMGKYQVGKNLSDQEVTEITAFLSTLTGEYEGRPVE
jgi:cytochrome c peroxidase